MTTTPARILPSGLVEGSAAANAAEAAESARLDALLGITPAYKPRRTPDRRTARARAYGDGLLRATRTR